MPQEGGSGEGGVNLKEMGLNGVKSYLVESFRGLNESSWENSFYKEIYT